MSWLTRLPICEANLSSSKLNQLETFLTKIKMHFQTKIASLAALLTLGSCQSVTKVNDFNAGPTKLGMYVYVPKGLTTPAPIVVAVHHCQGSAQGYSTESHYMPLADSHKFILIYPNSRSSGGCFDVASTASMFKYLSLSIPFMLL
jgi:poly(3-hydroxybutyrate) depolymerase